ncbi:lysozyme [Rosenbergiella collisarenosi]|uniref:lysozyme n=1 Tax=Rosenbergiella collisarenosi TaxID=1544695 RepID=UPI001BD950E4|nr:lysozyme [Rosenbergiella collisarenosi]MBT0720432.1 lysozyme [Rosenbergiella collisarenosi]
MNISNNGIAFIKNEEGERLSAYQDSRGIWTIGVGHTGLVNLIPIGKGMAITSKQSSEILKKDLSWVESAITDNVKVKLNQNQYDALCSFVFNIGVNAFKSSTMLKELNAGHYSKAADCMLMWSRAGSNQNILASRRQRERGLFNAAIN